MKKLLNKILGFLKKFSKAKQVFQKTKVIKCAACGSEIKVRDFSGIIKCPKCKYKFTMQPPAK